MTCGPYFFRRNRNLGTISVYVDHRFFFFIAAHTDTPWCTCVGVSSDVSSVNVSSVNVSSVNVSSNVLYVRAPFAWRGRAAEIFT